MQKSIIFYDPPLAINVRSKRNSLLKESDWTQLADSPLSVQKKDEWATYRQLLRDVPQQPGFPENVTFPTKPE